MRTTKMLLALAATFSFNACDCGGSATNHAPGGLTVTPKRLEFGAQTAGATVTKTVSLTNPGIGPLTDLAAKIEDDTRHAFTVGSLATTLSGGETLTLQVTYTAPSTPGSDAATLSITGEAVEAHEVTVDLTASSTNACATSETNCTDGADDDCDGKIDCADSDCAASPACATVDACAGGTASEVRISNDTRDSGGASLVVRAGGYAVAWMDSLASSDLNLAFRLLDADGAPTGDQTSLVPTHTLAHPPHLVASSDGFGVGFSDIRQAPNDVYLVRADATGSIVGETPISSDPELSFPADAAFNPTADEWVVVWGSQMRQDAGDSTDVVLQRVSSAGTLTGDRSTIFSNPDGTVDYPLVTWDGTRYLVVWVKNDSGDLVLQYQWLDATGNASGSITTLPKATGTNDYSQAPATSADHAAIAYAETTSATAGEVMLQRLDSTGAPDGDPISVATLSGVALKPALAIGQDAYALAWTTVVDGKKEVHFRRVGFDGSLQGTEAKVTCGDSDAFGPSLVAISDGFALAWTDTRDGNSEVYWKALPARPE